MPKDEFVSNTKDFKKIVRNTLYFTRNMTILNWIYFSMLHSQPSFALDVIQVLVKKCVLTLLYSDSDVCSLHLFAIL